MIDLHTPTLLLVILVVSFTLSATLASVARRFKRDGMMYWAWGFVLHTLTYVLFVLRGHISDLVSVVLANTLLAISFALISEGVQQFLQVRWSRWLVWAPVPLVAVLFFVLLGHAHTRIILSGVIIAWQCALIAWQLGSQPDKTTGRGGLFCDRQFSGDQRRFCAAHRGRLVRRGGHRVYQHVQSCAKRYFLVCIGRVDDGVPGAGTHDQRTCGRTQSPIGYAG